MQSAEIWASVGKPGQTGRRAAPQLPAFDTRLAQACAKPFAAVAALQALEKCQAGSKVKARAMCRRWLPGRQRASMPHQGRAARRFSQSSIQAAKFSAGMGRAMK
jgi:hypothetical protein